MTEEKKEKKEEKVEEKKEEKPVEKEAPKEEKKEAKPAKPTATKVNYVHAALLLHSAGKPISEDSLSKVIEAVGVSADDAQVKSLVSSLEGVDINNAVSQVAAAPVAAPSEAKEEKKEEKKEENTEKKAEEAAAGLSNLFG
jgi:large subunit ribosomal protein L12